MFAMPASLRFRKGINNRPALSLYTKQCSRFSAFGTIKHNLIGLIDSSLFKSFGSYNVGTALAFEQQAHATAMPKQLLTPAKKCWCPRKKDYAFMFMVCIVLLNNSKKNEDISNYCFNIPKQYLCTFSEKLS